MMMLAGSRSVVDVRRTPERESLHADLERALRALHVAEAADLCLKSGDDAALELLGFAPEHIAALRNTPRGARAGYPPYALKNLKATIRLLRTRLTREAVN